MAHNGGAKPSRDGKGCTGEDANELWDARERIGRLLEWVAQMRFRLEVAIAPGITALVDAAKAGRQPYAHELKPGQEFVVSDDFGPMWRVRARSWRDARELAEDSHREAMHSEHPELSVVPVRSFLRRNPRYDLSDLPVVLIQPGVSWRQ